MSIICLFDVDGTLTKARQVIEPQMLDMLAKLRKKCAIGFVGGSDLAKQKEQIGDSVLGIFDYCFPENGLNAYKDGVLINTMSFVQWLGEEKYLVFVNCVLKLLSDIILPVKRGTFIEFRTGMINISPIGRSCSQKERDEFELLDSKYKIRETMVCKLQEAFPDYGLKYSIGGQISFDVFPIGWDKTYCLEFLDFKTIHFFGDKIHLGGNDYEIGNHERVVSHPVKNPQETLLIVESLFNL